MQKLKVVSYSPEEAKDMLEARLKSDKKYREVNFENSWKANENLLYKNNGLGVSPTLSYSSLAEVYQMKASESSNNIHIPRVAQNLRFLHSQMSANPPSVIPQPTSNELEDRRATQAVDDLIKYGRKQYKLQEYLDLTNLSTLTYGTGFVKSYHDPHGGETLKFDKSTSEITMTGDFKCRPILIWDLWFDRDAKCWEDVRYTFERFFMPLSQASSIWPEYEELFVENIVNTGKHPSKMESSVIDKTVKEPDDIKNQLVEIYEYTEKALPENGMAGRRCFHLSDGTILGKMEENPHPGAILPYGVLTDMDIPGEVYGKTTVDYAIGLARVVDTLDNMIFNNVELHGSIKLVVFDQAETNEENYSDNPVDIITVNGTHAHAPYQLKPASVSGDIYAMRNQMLEAIDGIMGVNEILQGQINRELSGFASQTAINAANMVRHRLFNKYTALVEFIYTTYLDSIKENWKVKRKIKIIGKEDAQTIKYIEGADIKSGYILSVEYGANFSLDPAMRREEILQAREILLDAGVNPKKIAQMLKYNEIDALFDAPEMARKRQIEIFERAIERYNKTGIVDVEPASKMRKAYHLEMAEAALEFVMTNDFLTLDDELKEAIYSHIDEREQMAAQQATPGQPAPGVAPAGPAQPGMPMPAMPGMPPIPDIGGVL